MRIKVAATKSEEDGSALSAVKMSYVNSWFIASTVMCVRYPVMKCGTLFCLEYAYVPGSSKK